MATFWSKDKVGRKSACANSCLHNYLMNHEPSLTGESCENRFLTLAYDTSVKRCPMFSAKTVPSIATNSTHGKKKIYIS